jgi:hypothetical protein
VANALGINEVMDFKFIVLQGLFYIADSEGDCYMKEKNEARGGKERQRKRKGRGGKGNRRYRH